LFSKAPGSTPGARRTKSIDAGGWFRFKERTPANDMQSANAQKNPIGLQLVMLVLSVYVLVALFVDTVFALPEEVSALLQTLDTLICLVFLLDFFYHLHRAENKLAFLKWGWIDFISSIPTLTLLRWGRIVQVVRLIRVLRAIRSVKFIFRFLFEHRAQGTFGTVLLITVMLVIFSSITILNVETAPEANIKTAGDALWWAASTVTTAGYGDKYPVTTEGRILGVMLMTAGVGFFGTLTAYIASLFLGAGKAEARPETDLANELKLIRERIESLESKLHKIHAELPAQFGKPPEPPAS
jgi:voltage-gated potassium channel